MFRVIGLHDHLSRHVRPAGTARHLGDQLEGALHAAVVRQVQRQVRRNDAHQRHVGKIQALGDHLGAHQHIGFAAAKAPEDAGMGVLFPGGVHVHAKYPGVGKQPPDLLLDLLGACAEVLDVTTAALGALLRGGQGLATVVAAQGVFRLVVGHGHIALVAAHHIAAGTA